MQWTPTDQFGNLNKAESSAESWQELNPAIASLIDELTARHEGPIVLTIDLDYTEVNGPDPDRVSHILLVPWLAYQTRDDARTGMEGVLSDLGCSENISVALSAG